MFSFSNIGIATLLFLREAISMVSNVKELDICADVSNVHLAFAGLLSESRCFGEEAMFTGNDRST